MSENLRHETLEKVRKEAEQEQKKRREEMGIPEGFNWPTLFYNAPTQTLVVQLQDGSSPGLKRIFARRITEPKYQLVGVMEENISCENIVVSATKPNLYFSTLRLEGDGGNWERLYKMDLTTFAITEILSRTSLSITSDYKDIWLSNLLNVSSDERSLDCCVCLPILQRSQDSIFPL